VVVVVSGMTGARFAAGGIASSTIGGTSSDSACQLSTIQPISSSSGTSSNGGYQPISSSGRMRDVTVRSTVALRRRNLQVSYIHPKL